MSVPNKIRFGNATMGGGTRTVLTTNTAKFSRQIEIRAQAANSGPVYLGDYSVLTTTGYELPAGATVKLIIDAGTSLYFAGPAGAIVSWIAT
ncbi:hypothetical protein SEA_KIKO_33 [Gordonia phage Kiko]|nr:hypothetical protein SEA_KIKO_33 [Gordonia phage Kiko]